MRFVLISFSGILGALFLWGLISPRSQWYALVGWTRSDPRDTEPGSGAYGVSRIVSLIGLLALLVIAGVSFGSTIDWEQSRTTRPQSEAERLWGQPRPFVVDRVFTSVSTPPASLVEQSVTGYQAVNGSADSPRYLFEMGKVRSAGLATERGFLGVEPLPGTVALDTADIVVHVLGDDRCIPQQVVVIPVDGAVQIGTFFGQPQPAEGEESDVGNCDPGPPASRTRGYLIPIDLDVPLGDRVVQSLDGTPVTAMPLPAS